MAESSLMDRARRIYDERLRQELERSHLNSFVAIEPDSGDYFLGETLSAASAAAHSVHPNRRYCVLRVGHRTTLHIGAVAT